MELEELDNGTLLAVADLLKLSKDSSEGDKKMDEKGKDKQPDIKELVKLALAELTAKTELVAGITDEGAIAKFTKLIEDQKLEFASQIKTQLESKDKEIEAVKTELSKNQEALVKMAEEKREADRKAEFESFKTTLSKGFWPDEMKVVEKYGVLPASGEKIFKFSDTEKTSLLEFAIELMAARPPQATPAGQVKAEAETSAKPNANVNGDAEAIKLRLTMYEESLKGRGVAGDELKKMVDSYKANLVSPN